MKAFRHQPSGLFFLSNLLKFFCVVWTYKVRVRKSEFSRTFPPHQITALHLPDRCCLLEIIHFASESECLFVALNIKQMIYKTYVQKELRWKVHEISLTSFSSFQALNVKLLFSYIFSYAGCLVVWICGT